MDISDCEDEVLDCWKDYSSRNKGDESLNEKMLVHMFLTKETPKKVEDDLEEIESDLLAQVINSVSALKNEQLTPVKIMLTKWMKVQPFTENVRSDVFRSALGKLKNGSTIPLYIREQNCTILVSKVRRKFRIQTFRPSLPCTRIMSNASSLQMEFPETSEIIENEELLLSKIFSSHLYEMAEDEFQMSKGIVEKGGSIFTEIRDVADPFLVMDWAVGVLVPKEDKGRIAVTKKLRDQVTMGTEKSRAFLPFRRSGMWMSIKVTLQLKLLEIFRKEDSAKLMYKLAMLRVLVDACKKYKVGSELDLDVAPQLIAKIGRRVFKLKQLTLNMSNESLEGLRSAVLDYTFKIMTGMKQRIERTWNTVTRRRECLQIEPSGRSKEEFIKDLMHFSGPLNELLVKARQLVKNPNASGSGGKKRGDCMVEKRRYDTFQEIVSATTTFSSRRPTMIWLHDTERFIKEMKAEDFDHGVTSEEIFNLGQKYFLLARRVYKDNPLGNSQMFLISLKIAYILDKIASNQHPLLEEYRPDISVSSFDSLLLPHLRDVKLLNELVAYFNVRDAKGSQPFLEREVCSTSFSARFAGENVAMQELKRHMKSTIEAAKLSKMAEIDRVRAECHDLQEQMELLGGECYCQYQLQDEEYWNSGSQKMLTRQIEVQILKCDYCPMRRKLDAKRRSVGYYEIPLPPQEHLANAVVFELLIPNEISYLRQFLAILKFEMLRMPVFNCRGSIEVAKKWLDYSGIRNCSSVPVPSTNLVSLGSTSWPSSEVNPTTRCPDLLAVNLATDAFGYERFIVNNGMNCCFYFKASQVFPPVESLTSFQIGWTANPDPYLPLLKYFISTTHNQNDVIASQCECHSDLSLNEYVTFGSLRGGHRIQLRNLYMALSNRSLTLEKEPVLALILQTIWQVGAMDKKANRETHVDFHNHEFSTEFLEMLEKLVKSNEANYSIPLVVLTAVVITGRIMELNESCRDKCYELFKEWRQLTSRWCEKIETELRSNDKTVSEKDKLALHATLHDIKLCAIMTYNVASPKDISNVIKDSADVAHYLHIISSKYKLFKESNLKFSKFRGILQVLEGNVPVQLRLGVKQDIILNGIFIFIREKFPSARSFCNEEWNITERNSIFTIEFPNSYFIKLDILTGELLINGYPESELSSKISENPKFQRFFKTNLNFRVQRQSESVLGTVDPIHGKHYEFITGHSLSSTPISLQFGLTSSRMANDLEIVEIQKDRTKLVLVPHEHFRPIVNDYFVDNYTHWIDPIKGQIYFRKIATAESDHDLPHEYVFKFREEHEKWMLRDEINQQYVMSIKSPGYLLITSQLSRLELPHHINVVMDSNMEHVGAHLPRHNLRFALNRSTGFLESLEYAGFQVCQNQDSGTFIGLKHGLLLENGDKRNVIIPHGKINVVGVYAFAHHSCEIQLKSLSNPPFYIYEIDDVLKRIIGKKSVSAWLYLAALHAITASSQVDPFTRVTGTEMAVRILQSAFVWSCSPYDKASLQILKFIKGMSPKRNYYGHYFTKNVREAIETVDWPKGIPTMVAYDGYAFLVNKLVKDSIRLVKLHPISKDCNQLYNELNMEVSSEKLVFRGYLQNLGKYNDEVRLSQEFLKASLRKFRKVRNFPLELRSKQENLKLGPVLLTAYIRHNSIIQGKKGMLFPFLFTKAPLEYCITTMPLSLTKLLSLTEFRTHWLTYYSMAILETGGQDYDHEFTLLLSAFGYRGVPQEQINFLNCIQRCTRTGKVKFPKIPPEINGTIENPTRWQYVETEISDILKRYVTSFWEKEFPNSKLNIENKKEIEIAQKEYEAKAKEHCAVFAKKWKTEFWPCAEIPGDEDKILTSTVFRSGTLNAVNHRISEWFRARKLKLVLEKVQKLLNENLEDINLINDRVIPTLKTSSINVRSQKCEMEMMKLEDFMTSNDKSSNSVTDIEQLMESVTLTTPTYWERSKDICQLNVLKIWDMFKAKILENIYHKILNKAGLVPRLTPLSLLGTLLSNQNPCGILHDYVGSLAILWTRLKLLNRITHFHLHGQQADLERELENSGHSNWSPMEHPEWLLLELELDIMIRDVQVHVARRMMEMPDGKNGVMQLNMGEGKTSVIVPMLCSVLAKDDSLCRVTVLSSIFKMNWGILKFAIGGLLNRRLYSFPCRRRNMALDMECVSEVQAVYQECMRMKGVVLTLPEYRLSFRSLAYDKILKGDTLLGLKLLETEDWLRSHARDILDESDELLGVKYQLVYTIGSQVALDGEDLRWGMCQRILDIIQEIAPHIAGNMCEYDAERKETFPHEFVHFRLHADKESDFIKEFEILVAERFLAEVDLTETNKNLVAQFLLDKEVSVGVHKYIIGMLEQDPGLKNRILILAGYIHRGILSLALSKRWRVEYGVDPKGFCKMAVPFRAKDVAAERTEFGHPDLAIILTHLSYYYSELSNSEMEEVFQILSKKLSPEAIYGEWIGQIPSSLVPSTLNDYRSLNLKDGIQKSSVFELLRKHKMVIDFWLSHTVFPRESKQFPGKLVMTAWDLIYERHKHPVAGFSGTNDSIILLPLTINQQDLESLKGTNEKMEKILLGKENSCHRSLKMGVTCTEILEQMREDNLRILIDSGALMLELDNPQVAERWLQIDPEIQAVVYFNHENELMVKSRSSGVNQDKIKSSRFKISDVPFELSPFQGRLGECAVFLDDQHTRGTDLKLPMGSKACVTIGSRMKREKLLQACMRMRKLGQGHSVKFYLSHEASLKVKVGGIRLSTQSILNWVKKNTKEFNDDGLLYWAIAGKNYAQRLAAEDIFHFVTKSESKEKAQILAKQCVDQEVMKLMDMYGQLSKLELLHELVAKWFDMAKQKLVHQNRTNNIIPEKVMTRFHEIRNAVIERCFSKVPNRRHLSSSTIADEEQEKELEIERETEVEVQQEVVPLIKRCSPAKPSLHPNVVRMITERGTFKVINGVSRLSDIFRNTTFASEVQPSLWSVEVYATNDFISVIAHDLHNRTDSYLRPMEYFVSNRMIDRTRVLTQVMFLSPFEVNCLMPKFRNHETVSPLHMFATRRMEKQDMLFNLKRLQVPQSPGLTFPVLRSGSREMAAMLVASGSLYFQNDEEQKAFASFLSLVPKPWTRESRELFEKGLITQTGFLLPGLKYEKGFQRDPTALVRKILKCRHTVVSDFAHVVKLLDTKRYIEFGRAKAPTFSALVPGPSQKSIQSLTIPKPSSVPFKRSFAKATETVLAPAPTPVPRANILPGRKQPTQTSQSCGLTGSTLLQRQGLSISFEVRPPCSMNFAKAAAAGRQCVPGPVASAAIKLKQQQGQEGIGNPPKLDLGPGFVQVQGKQRRKSRQKK